MKRNILPFKGHCNYSKSKEKKRTTVLQILKKGSIFAPAMKNKAL